MTNISTIASVLLRLALVICYIFGSITYAQTPTQCDSIYAIHDKSVEDSRIFSYNLNDNSFNLLGPLYTGTDLEGLDVHPSTKILYASTGQLDSQLYTVDSIFGTLSLIGNIGFDNVKGLAFHPDGQLWGSSDQGLLQIDIDTGIGIILGPVPSSINSLAWNQEGTKLFATTNTHPNSSTLWAYDNEWRVVCEGLPKKVESLETTPDGLLIYAFHKDSELGIHTFDVNNCQTITDDRVITPFNDIEGIAWPICGELSNLDYLRTYLNGLDGVTQVDIQSSGAIAVTQNGEIHQSQLAETVIPGEPPVDAQLVMTPIVDQNGDGIDDFQITYPSGDQQVVYYLGIQEEIPEECKNLVIPPIDPTVISIPSLVTEFLYTGSDPIQTGVASGTINLEHAATIRGLVTDVAGDILSNVIITIKNHPEYGQTITTCDGSFNMAINGGGTLTVNYQKAGYLPIQRTVSTVWQQYAVLDDVVMTELDPLVTAIDLTADIPIQVAKGSVVTDVDGSRQAVVLFPQGVTATMTLPDGSTQSLTQLDVRATEYTVGEKGPEAMPAPLPPASAYTYAVDLSVDQAIAAGATRVDFSQPVPLYVDNFLGFPVGGIVPVGWYDSVRGAWIPSDNGRVVEIISIVGGLAVLDVDGSGQAASSSALAELGITDDERQQLTKLYSPGKSLWRSPIPHFTPWDCNWPYAPPEDATPPSPEEEPKTKDEDNPDKTCEEKGCIIEAESQVLGETLAITGTSFSLNYRSNRVRGYKVPYSLEISLRGDSVPNSLKMIALEVNIAGKQFKEYFPPSTKKTTFIWDGLDSFGRYVQGRQDARIHIGYSYEMVYTQPNDFEKSFGRLANNTIAGLKRGRKNFTIWQNPFTKSLGAWYPTGIGLGSFNLNVHHVYNPITKTLYQGNGSTRGARANRVRHLNGLLVEEFAGQYNRYGGFSGDGGPATEAKFYRPNNLAFGPDGSLYIVDKSNYRIRKIDSDGIVTTVAGNGSRGYSGDGGLATRAKLEGLYGIAFGPDGNLYIADNYNDCIRRVNSDRIINTVVDADLHSPYGIAFAPDGSLYVSERHGYRISKVDVDGVVNTIAGSFLTSGFSGDYSLAINAKFNHPIGIAFDSSGKLYIADYWNHRVRRISTNGIIKTVAGSGGTVYSGGGFSGDGSFATGALLNRPTSVAVDPDGNLYIADNKNSRIRQVNKQGRITTIVSPSKVTSPEGLQFGPDGNLYFTDTTSNQIFRLRSSAFPSFSLGNITIPSGDGSLVYEFTSTGRHVSTADSITGRLIYIFSYTDNGYLETITDLDGDVTRIARDGDIPKAIIAPDGQRTTLTLDANGYLETVTNPENEVYKLSYSDDGLLKEFTNPRKHTSIYRYDDLGLLEEDTDAAGGGWILARTDNPDGDGYTTTMTSKENRITSYQVKPQSNGDMLRINTSPDGTVSQTLIKTNGETVITSPDGTQVVSKQGPDPRFGMQAPFAEQVTITTPDGLTSVVTTEKTAELTDVNNPLSVESLTTKITTNGKVSIGIYDAANKKTISTSAAGRQTVSYFDNKGRVIKDETPELANVYYGYDDRGRLETITEGDGDDARITTFGYDPDNGYLKSVTDPLNHTEEFTTDKVGRIEIQKLPDGRQIKYDYDENGNVTGIIPPNKPIHELTYNSVDKQEFYIPPKLADISEPQTKYEYNLDKQLEYVHRPDGKTVELVYDPVKKHLNSIKLPNGDLTYTYDENTGQLESIADISGESLSYNYDGSLPLSEVWQGTINGKFSLSYNNDFKVKETKINSSNAISYSYDNDGLLIQAGSMTLVRDLENGLLQNTELGSITSEQTYNQFREIKTVTVKKGIEVLYLTDYTHRDKLGRIKKKTETIEGIQTNYEYHYDLAGRLDEVKQDDVVIETYSYDDNGNRLTADTTNGSVVGKYDDQDRLIQYGNAIYNYTNYGELRFKEENGQVTEYTYDVLGNLRSVKLPDNTLIEYVIDGRNRRIGKKINGTLVKGFLYQGSLNPIAELDSNGNIVSQFVYGSKINIPDYILKYGNTYKILSNHLGSPKLVVDINDGSIVQKIDYDAFGNVIEDTSPGFQPFGFAGGIYDLDTKLTRFGARDYDAQIGRWTAKDPILFSGGDTNLFGYVLNDPMNLVDPYGLSKCNPDDKDCIDKCLRQNYGELYDIASHLSPLSLIPLALNEFSSEVSDRLSRTANRNLYSISRYNYNVGVRQAKTLAQFNKFNAGMAIATAGALGFQAGAYAYCYLSCY